MGYLQIIMVVIALLIIGASLTVGLSGMNDTTTTATLSQAQQELGKRASKAILYANTPASLRRTANASTVGFMGAEFGNDDVTPLELGAHTWDSGEFSVVGTANDSIRIEYTNTTGIKSGDGSADKKIDVVAKLTGARFISVN